MPDKRNEVPKNRHEMHYLYDELVDLSDATDPRRKRRGFRL